MVIVVVIILIIIVITILVIVIVIIMIVSVIMVMITILSAVVVHSLVYGTHRRPGALVLRRLTRGHGVGLTRCRAPRLS